MRGHTLQFFRRAGSFDKREEGGEEALVLADAGGVVDGAAGAGEGADGCCGLVG